MPVLGVASKLRQPAVGSKPVHTALPIPNLGPAGSQKYSPKSLELTGAESSMLACQLTLKSTCDFGERKTLQGKTQEIEDSKVSCKLYLWNSIIKKKVICFKKKTTLIQTFCMQNLGVNE